MYLNKIYPTTFFRSFNYLIIFLSAFLFESISAQNNEYVIFENEAIIRGDSCVTNKSNYATFKLKKVKEETSLDSLKIQTEANYINKEFTSLNTFNNFDFKFWLLSNDAFKYEGELTIRLFYKVDNRNITQEYEFCLEFISVDASAIKRGDDPTAPDYVKLPVYFGTDRNFNPNEEPNDAFGVNRGKLSYGIVEVSIPHDHRIGEIETPSIWRFEFSEDPSKHIMLHKIDRLGKKQFFLKLAKDIAASDKKSTFLFVHGYNTSFSEAAKRTAQISYDLKFDGKAVFYSWPSKASTFSYRADEENIEWSRKNLKVFLEDYLAIAEAEDIYLVAHSMGNRGLTRAIVEVLDNKPKLRSKIKEIILAAPDIDADVFKNEIAPQMVSSTKKPITLYVSADDLALKASRMLHGKPRAGDADDKLVIVNGVETIDATGIDTSFLNHSYFADSQSIISDIFDLIQKEQRALERKRLNLIKLENQIYFKVKK